MDTTAQVARLRACQIMRIENDQANVAIRLETDDDQRFYIVTRSGLSRLAEALSNDARIVNAH
jgi:hypothetical protein